MIVTLGDVSGAASQIATVLRTDFQWSFSFPHRNYCTVTKLEIDLPENSIQRVWEKST